MQKFVAMAVAVAVNLFAVTAHALRPDFDGERGVEAFATVGYGSLFYTRDPLFLSERDPAFHVSQPVNALGGGAHLVFGAGYRMRPWISAGLRGQLQFLHAEPVVSPGGTSFPSDGGGASFGVYCRLYPMVLVNPTRYVPRVSIDRWDDPRRLDPWVSLGVEYQDIWRKNYNDMRPDQEYRLWHRRSVGVPLTVGGDVRILPPLAVGLSLGITPLFGAWIEETQSYLSAGNQRTESRQYQGGIAVTVS